eukprot:ANDGO_07122.mRNA.1 5'-3' exoribonuclease 1
MGVPRFFRWISERYPLINNEVRDDTMPEIDNLYLDMNGIIHRATHGDNDATVFSEERVMIAIYQYIDRLFDMVRPRKIFFMAIDGVAPRAKMNQQRQRRFKSALELALHKEQQLAGLADSDDGEAKVVEPLFDSCSITPGTEFMAKLTKYLEFFVKKKISEDRNWQRCEVVLSGHEYPGEGEHKIMDFIRARKSAPAYSPDERHCLYGLDADLIMLSLASHEPHFVLLREEIQFGNKPQKSLRGQTEEELRHEIRDETRFHLLYINLLREYLEFEFRTVELPFGFDLDRVIDDFILMCFFMGNDFLPSLPTFNIGEGSLNDLFDIYRQVLPELGGYITLGANVDFARLSVFLQNCVDNETQSLKDMSRDLSWLENSKETMSFRALEAQRAEEDAKELAELQKTGSATSDSITSASTSVPHEEDDDVLLMAAALDEFDLGALKVIPRNDEAEWKEVHSRSKPKRNADPSDLRQMFYHNKLGVQDGNEVQGVSTIIRSYIEGIMWNLKYYYEGVPSWRWFYPYHHAPFVFDLSNADLAGIASRVTFDPSEPFLPFLQLMGVLPVASANLVPEPLQQLMTSRNSPLKDYYPLRFEVDRDPRKPDWEAIVMIPFVDEERLVKAFREIPHAAFTEAERKRNELGHTYRYVYDPLCAEGQQSVPSPNLNILTDLKHSFCRKEIADIPPTGDKFKPVVPAGCRVGVDGPPGFPTFAVFPHISPSLAKIGLNIFGSATRKASCLLSIPTVPTDPRSAGELVGLLSDPNTGAFRNVFVDMPFFLEAKIKYVSDRDFTYTYNQQASRIDMRRHDAADLDWFDRNLRALESTNRTKKAIDLGPVYLLLTVSKLEGYQRDFRGKVIPQFSDADTIVPLQLCLWNYTTVPRHVRQLGNISDSIFEQFPVGSDVVYVGEQFYGSVGRVLGIEAGRSVSVELHVKQRAVPDSPFVQGTVRWLQGRKIAQDVGLGPRALSQITSSLVVQIPGQPTRELGLGIKLSRKDLRVSGWARKIITSTEVEDPTSPGQSSGYWEFSDKTRDKLVEYKSKFPWLFTALTDDAKLAKGKLTIWDIFPQHPPAVSQPEGSVQQTPESIAKYASECEQQIAEAAKWMSQFRASNKMMLVPADTERLSHSEISAVLKKITALQESTSAVWQRVILRNVSPVLLYASGDHAVHGTGAVLRRAFHLGDRVVSTRNAGAVPFGLCGTIVELRQTSADVVFDEEFLLARNIQHSSEVNAQSQNISLSHLLNLSWPIRRESKHSVQVSEISPLEDPSVYLKNTSSIHAGVVSSQIAESAPGTSYAVGSLVRSNPPKEKRPAKVAAGAPASAPSRPVVPAHVPSEGSNAWFQPPNQEARKDLASKPLPGSSKQRNVPKAEPVSAISEAELLKQVGIQVGVEAVSPSVPVSEAQKTKHVKKRGRRHLELGSSASVASEPVGHASSWTPPPLVSSFAAAASPQPYNPYVSFMAPPPGVVMHPHGPLPPGMMMVPRPGMFPVPMYPPPPHPGMIRGPFVAGSHFAPGVLPVGQAPLPDGVPVPADGATAIAAPPAPPANETSAVAKQNKSGKKKNTRKEERPSQVSEKGAALDVSSVKSPIAE